jgi:hypothetical protein
MRERPGYVTFVIGISAFLALPIADLGAAGRADTHLG